MESGGEQGGLANGGAWMLGAGQGRGGVGGGVHLSH